ncbi:MAG: glycerophosphodiester phosphodiesterase family protein [Lentisphaeria bacterium]|nr:glycerophosphodiester phosphodiesterase family protein [Lentisphaeria bacterium]
MIATYLLLGAALFAQGPALTPPGARAPDATPALHRIDARTPEGLRQLFRPGDGPLPFVDGHRGGGREGFPENCIATFEDTLRHTYAIMEVDPRPTQDGELVLHHDATLERTTNGRGRVADRTLAGLRQLRLRDAAGTVTDFRIPTLDEALDWARGRTVLVLDQKEVPATERVRRISERGAEAWALVIVYSFRDALACHALNPDVMMEVMIPNRQKAEEFDALGIPWSHVIAFVGHTPPEDAALYRYIRQRGASCLIGTSRNLDRRILARDVPDVKALEPDYLAFLSRGVDLIETDIPTLLGPLLASSTPVAEDKREFLLTP